MILVIGIFIGRALAFILGWMIVEFIKSKFGFKIDWTEQWLRATLAGMIFAFAMYLLG